MATKEEIWENKFKTIAGGIDYIITEFPTSWRIEEKLNEAMDEWADIKVGEFISNQNSLNFTTTVPKHILDEYAKQEAIDFLIWADDLGYTRIVLNDGFKWESLNDMSRKTNDELYNLFKQHQIKEK